MSHRLDTLEAEYAELRAELPNLTHDEVLDRAEAFVLAAAAPGNDWIASVAALRKAQLCQTESLRRALRGNDAR